MADRPPAGVVEPFAETVGTCPVCDGPIYAWVTAPAADASRGEEIVLDRCERCGAAVARQPGGVAMAVDAGRAAADAELELLFQASANGSGRELRAANRRSLQAAIGEGSWAGLELPDRSIVLTPIALELLLERRGARLERLRFPLFGRNQRWMWQTLMNALTFHPNFAREALSGRLRPRRGVDRLTFAVDAVVSVLAAPLVALVSVPLEAVAALARRGGEMRAEVGAAPAAGSPAADIGLT